jgi:arsenate reductase-like glutaredoxin family protein
VRASLLQKGVELEERDFFADPLSDQELRDLIGNRPASQIFSWNSPSFKKLGVTRDDLDDDRLIQLMLDEPRLIRRPLVQVGGEVFVGTDKEAMRRALG